MIDTSNFTSQVRLPEGQTCPFFYGHIALMDLNEHDLDSRAQIPDWLDPIKGTNTHGTIVYRALLRQTDAFVWDYPHLARTCRGLDVIPTGTCGTVTIPLCRCARQFFAWAETTMQLRRIQIIVRSSECTRAKTGQSSHTSKRESEMYGFWPYR